MELKDQIIQEYLATGCGYRKLQKKYGFSRTTICNWVQVYQGVHNLPPTVLQQKHYLNPMERKEKNKLEGSSEKEQELLQKIASLEKQLAHQELRAEVLDTLINVAEKQLNISIRKKPGTQQSSK
ncbi:MAG: transposase [Segetibacter sp.]|jgi:transposase|nr:transposase [Segetibacter sp.]